MLLSLLFSGFLYHFGTRELSEGFKDQYLKIVTINPEYTNNTRLSKSEYNTRANQLKEDLLYFNVVVLAGACIGSYVLARRTLRPIEEAHQSQIRFTADASHELRTPLTAMRADTEATLMSGTNDISRLRQALQDNLKDIQRLQNLTDHLIDISRHDSKAVTVSETIDLANTANDVLSSLSSRIHDKHIETEEIIENVTVKGESQSLHQLITIFLDNAIKYSSVNGHIKIKVTKKGDKAVIIIEDNGIGIPAIDLPHIFERFYRSKNTKDHKEKLKGYGLGLPLAKDIVDLHGGSVTVRSTENQGTVITITLPVA